MQIKVDTKPLKNLQKEFENAPPLIDREFRLEIERSAKAIETAYKRNARRHFKTGHMDASISADSNDGWKSASIGSTELYSIFLEVGAKAHLIKPKTAKALKFFWEKMGVDAVFKKVKHPGTPAFNILLKAYIEVMEPFDQKFGERLKERLKKVPL